MERVELQGGGGEPEAGRASDDPRVVWSQEARRRLLPRRRGQGPASSRVYARGLLAELADLAKRLRADERDAARIARGMRSWKEMRRLVAEASQGTYAEARDAAEAMRKDAPLSLRCFLAFAFPTEPAWSRSDAEACLAAAAQGAPLPAGASLLFTSLDDQGLVLRLLDALPSAEARVEIAAYVFELVESLGAGARPALERLYDEAVAQRDVKGAARRCLEAMEILLTDETAAFFAKRLDANEVRPIASRYFRAAPELAVKALAPIGARRGKAAEAAKTLLVSALAACPKLASAILPELGDTARRSVRAVRERTELTLEEASPEELPPILVDPPWRSGSGYRARSVEDLPLIDARAPLADAAGSSMDAWASRIHWVPNALVFSARVALPVAHAWLHRPEARPDADAWLVAFPSIAAVGLVPAAVGKPSAARIDAGRMLRLLASRGHEAEIRRAAALYGEEPASIIEDVLALDPLRDCPDAPPKLPAFLRVEALPRPLCAGRAKALPLSATSAICEMLAFSREGFPYAGLDVVKAACDPASLAELAWAIFAAFSASGASLRQPWPLHALALLGDDTVARRLALQIRSWSADKAAARADAGVDVLARLDSDVALMHLSAIAETARSPDLRDRASAKIAAVAEARGLLPEDLADRLVPDLDLDPDGSKSLDYGARAFRVGFDEHLEPFVRDAAGVELRSLPKPSRTDDPVKARAAQETWKALRDDAAAIGRAQRKRLELAMCLRRRWDPASFWRLLCGHPLLVHMVRRLVWAVYDGEDRPARTFRVAEDRTLAGESDEPLDLMAIQSGRIGIPHPLELPPEARRAWGGLLSDYALAQPFAQIGRETYSPTAEERASYQLLRAEGATIATGKLFWLEGRGWRRFVDDAGKIESYRKEINGGPLSAVLWIHPGLTLDRAREAPEQTLGPVNLVSSKYVYTHPTFGELDAIAFSELARDIELLRG